MASWSFRDVNEMFWRLYERRLELLSILVTSVIIAFLVNILTVPLETIIEKIAQIVNIPKEATYILFLSIMIICILIMGYLYYAKPINFELGALLLINKDLGIVYPFNHSIEYSIVGSLALQAYLKDIKGPLFPEEYPSLKNSVLRDLLEVFIVDWLVSTTVFKVELLSGFSRPKIRYPKLGKQYKTLKTHDVLSKFGDNRFTKYLEGEHVIMFSEIKLPEKLIITCKRYEDSDIDLGCNEEPMRVPLASELSIEGSGFTPLKRLRIITYISRIAPGEKSILLASGLRPVEIGPNTIECIDKNGRQIVFSGKKRKELSSWIRIDFNIIISAEMKPFLFLHPKFVDTLEWLKKLYLRTIDYFTSRLNTF